MNNIIVSGNVPSTTKINIVDVTSNENGGFWVTVQIGTIVCTRNCGANWCKSPKTIPTGEPRFITIKDNCINVTF